MKYKLSLKSNYKYKYKYKKYKKLIDILVHFQTRCLMKMLLGDVERCLVGIGANINDSLIIIIIFYLEDKERNLILKGFTFNFTSSSSYF